MISVSQAIKLIKQNTPQIESEMITLEKVCGRVLAENIFADMDMPPFNRSQMDGYAIKAKDTKNAPAGLKIIGESAAGKSWSGKLKSGEAVRIMTGAAVPEGANAVQKLELTSESGEFVEIFEPVKKGQNLVARGAEIEKGKRVFSSGEIVNAKMIASLAAFGYSEILVGQRPTVAILSTGSEIVNVDEIPRPDQIRNSNSPMLRAFAHQCGAIVESLPIVCDDLSNLKSSIEKTLVNSDVLIMTGGVSVGKYDLTKLALNELGAEIYFEKIALRPGKPMVFARLKNSLIFGLPGNPVSAAVTFYLFVRQSLLQMQGASDRELKSGFAILASALKGAKERDSYLPVKLLTNQEGQHIAEPIKWGGSSDFVSFAFADALIIIPQNKIIFAGDTAEIVFLK
jgi:molybdenum cofactor synthesis domain-containing protein